MLSGARPTCANLVLRTGSPPPNSLSLNCETISLRSVARRQTPRLTRMKNNQLTDRKDTDDPIDSHTNDPLTLVLPTGPSRDDNLHPNIDRRLLAEPHDLCARAPVPAHEGLVGAGRDEVLGRERDGADAVEVACKLLERGERERREEVDTSGTPFE